MTAAVLRVGPDQTTPAKVRLSTFNSALMQKFYYFFQDFIALQPKYSCILFTLNDLRTNMATPEEAVALKKKGNEFFSKHEWLNAIDSYTKAIESYDKDPAFYCNRCQVAMFCTVCEYISSNSPHRLGTH